MMNPRFLAGLLLVLPAAASAAPHTVVFRAWRGTKSYSHAVKSEPDAQNNFVGRGAGGVKVIVNLVYGLKDGAYHLQYQTEFGAFQVQSSVVMKAGQRLTAAECGDWKLDVLVDAPDTAPAITAPEGENQKATIFFGKQKCGMISSPDTQSNIVDTKRPGGVILNAVVSSPDKGLTKFVYQFEHKPVSVQGEEMLSPGKKKSAQGGKLELLVELPARAATAAAPPPAAAPAEDEHKGVPLLR